MHIYIPLIYMYSCIYLCIYICSCRSILVPPTPTRLYICIYAYINAYMYMYVSTPTRLYICIYAYIYTYMYMYMCVYICMYVYMCVCIYTCWRQASRRLSNSVSKKKKSRVTSWLVASKNTKKKKEKITSCTNSSLMESAWCINMCVCLRK